MTMILTDEQRMLGETVGPFLASRAPVAHLRALRDRSDPDGFDRGLWKAFSDMGLSGMLIDESVGGTGLGQVEAGIVIEEIGRNLTPSPFLMTAVGAAVTLRQAPAALQQVWLPRIAAGDAVAAIALEESNRHRPDRIALRAEASGDGYRLNGSKCFVVQGGQADCIFVVARTEGEPMDRSGTTMFLVERGAAGLSVEDRRLVDSSLAATLVFTDVFVGSDRVIGEVGGAGMVLKPLLQALRTGIAAELVGLGSQAFAMTLAYLKDRSQFGKPIGGFQALQHRAAHLYCELEVARAAVLKAQQLMDAQDEASAAASMVAKAVAGSASALAVQEAVQMHGGVGMSDAFDVGFYMKRQRVLAELFGDADYQLDHLALRSGY